MARKPTRTPGQPDASADTEQAEQADEVGHGEADTGLPNAVDIDARFIRGPVLTRQGYVVPDEAWQKDNAAEFKARMGG